MPDQQLQQITTSDIVSILWAALGSAVSILLGLVGVLYHKLTQTDKEQQEQLDSGEDRFDQHSLNYNQLKNDISFTENRVNASIKAVEVVVGATEERVRNDLNGLGRKLKTEVAAVERRLYELELLIAKVECQTQHHHETLLIIKNQHFRNHGEKVE